MLDMLVAELGLETASVIVAKSIDNARELLGSISDLQRSGEMESLQRTVHSLSGLLQQFGFSDLGIRMEKAESDPALLHALVSEELLQSFERAAARLLESLRNQAADGRQVSSQLAV